MILIVFGVILNKQLEGRAVLEHIKTDKSGIMMYFETIENICFSIKVFNDEFSFKVKECEYHPINVLESIELVRNFIDEEHKTILRMFEFSGDNNTEQIIAAINFLNQNGYIVRMNLQKYINKWIAFTQRGMEPILHGRIISVSNFDEFFYVKCKNGEIRYPNIEDAIKFFDSKKECYEFK